MWFIPYMSWAVRPMWVGALRWSYRALPTTSLCKACNRYTSYVVDELPGWVSKLDAPYRLTLHKAQLFDAPVAEAVTTKPFGHWDWPLRYATPELALLELASEVKQNSDFEVLDKLFESATALRPQLLMKLLKACHHVKAQRLFLWFAERHSFAWFKRLEVEAINLGSGKRAIVKGEAFDKKYQITMPRMMKMISPSAYDGNQS